MRLFKLVLHNFRQYGKREVITFPQQGLIGILGKNGAGKSTLFNAIGWALYGKIKDVNKELIMNMQADKKGDDCYVELFFALHGVNYHVKRDLKKTNNCFVKTADGTPYAIGTSNVNSYIEENLFKMDYNAFCSCYYAEQDDFDNLVKLTPAKRVQTISKLLRIDAIDKASENTRKEYRQFKTEIDEARKHLRDETALTEQKKQLQNQLFTLGTQVGTLQTEYQTIEHAYKDALVKKAEGEADYKRYQELVYTVTQTTKEMDTLQTRQLAKDEHELTQLRTLKVRYDEIEKYKQVYHLLVQSKEEMTVARGTYREKMTLTKDIARLTQEITQYEVELQTLAALAQEAKTLDATIATNEAALQSAQEALSSQKTKHQELAFELRAKSQQLSELKTTKATFDAMGVDSPCPTCERPLGEHYEDKMNDIKKEAQALVASASELKQQLQTAEQAIHAQNAQLETLQQTLRTQRTEQMKQHGATSRLAMVAQEIASRTERLNELKTALAPIENVIFDEVEFNETTEKLTKATALYEEILRIENMLTKIPTLEASIEEVKAEIANLQQLLVQTEQAKQTLGFDEQAYQQLDQTVSTLQQALQAKKDAITQTQFAIQTTTKDIEHVETLLAEHTALLKEIAHKEEEMVLLGKLDEAYKRFKSDILAKLAPTLSEIMSNDIEIMTNGKYNQIELDDEYNIYIYRQGERHPLSFYSGGEKKLAALCQRLAISNLLVGQTEHEHFDMLAMDEVFGSMDNERQDNVIDMLRNLNEKFPQILMVSHADNVKESFDHVLEIKQDNTGNSTFNWLTEWDPSDVEQVLQEYEDAAEAL